MTGEHDFSSAWLRYAARTGLVLAAFLGIGVFGLVNGYSPFWVVLGFGLLVAVSVTWVLARRMVRSASFDGRRLRASTLTGVHELDVAELTELEWNARTNSGAALAPLAGAAARIGFAGGHLLVPMPAGADLLRELEEHRPDEHADPSGAAVERGREFDFSTVCRLWQFGGGAVLVAWIVFAVHSGVRDSGNPWVWASLVPALAIAAWFGRLLRAQFVRHAVLDGRRLRTTTVDGREHVLDVDDTDVDDGGLGGRMNSAFVSLRHPGGALRLPQPGGTELADRIRAVRGGLTGEPRG